MTDIDVTDQVEFYNPDDEYLPVTKCACGAKFKMWDFQLSVYEEGSECPKCGRRFYFRNSIRIFEVKP